MALSCTLFTFYGVQFFPQNQSGQAMIALHSNNTSTIPCWQPVTDIPQRSNRSEWASEWLKYTFKQKVVQKSKKFLMHQTKKRKQPKGIAVSGNEARGSGVKSRVGLDFDKLREAGWTISEMQSSSGDKVLFRYVNPSGKTIKSSRNVEKQLREEGT